jgi:endonuclease YncB( thermonuclease family)
VSQLECYICHAKPLPTGAGLPVITWPYRDRIDHEHALYRPVDDNVQDLGPYVRRMAQSQVMTRSWTAYATVLQVVDGDTFHATLDIGWGITLQPRRSLDRSVNPGVGTVRVLHADGRPYDAPEMSTAHGKDAHLFITTFVKPGMTLEVRSFHLDDFGRTLGAVTMPDGQDWADLMDRNGYVKKKS